MSTAAAHASEPPGRDHGPLADVVPIWRHTRHHSRPGRRSINGHHRDCPYPHNAVEHCSICQSIRKGKP